MICGFGVVFPVAILATPPLFVLCGFLLPHSRSKILAEYGWRWFPDAEKEGPGFQDRSGPKRFRRMPLRLMVGRNGYVSFAPRPMCGPGGVAGNVSPTSPPVCRGSTRRPSLRRTKGGIQDHLPRVGKRGSPVIKKKSSRSCVHKCSCSVKQHRGWKGRETQREPTRRGSGLEEDCKMEVEEETDCTKKLDEQKKSLQRQLRVIEKFTDMDPVLRDRQKERWKEELLPEHQKVQKRCLRSCRVCRARRGISSGTLAAVKKKCKCSVKKWKNGRHFSRHASRLCPKSRATVGGQQRSWMTKSRPCRLGKKEEAATRRSSMDVTLIQPCGSRSSHVEQRRQNTSSDAARVPQKVQSSRRS